MSPSTTTTTAPSQPSSSLPSFPKIAILGGGPVSLTLASMLTKSRIPYTLFEARSSPLTDPNSEVSTTQVSSCLDLHEESGLWALKECGLWAEFESLLESQGQVCEEAYVIADQKGKRVWDEFAMQGDGGKGEESGGKEDVGKEGGEGAGGGRGRPEVVRNELMALLLRSLKLDGDEAVGELRWGCKVLDIAPSSPPNASISEYTIRFTNTNTSSTSTEKYNLILDSSGAWSRARSLLTSTTPQPSSVSCITLTIPSIEEKYPHLAEFIGKGSYTASAAWRSVMAQRAGRGSARVYLMLREPEDGGEAGRPFLDNNGNGNEKGNRVRDEKRDVDGYRYLASQNLLNLTPSELSVTLLDPENGLFGTWCDELKELIRVGCLEAAAKEEKISVKPLYMLPIGFKWEHRAGLTMLGDAAHLMTPFAGEGVNCGMWDAGLLGRGLVAALAGEGNWEAKWGEIDNAVKEYEQSMFERMQPIAQGTWDNLEMIFDVEAPGPFVRFFESHMPPPPEEEKKVVVDSHE